MACATKIVKYKMRIVPFFVRMFLAYEAILIFCNLTFQDGCHMPLLNIAPKHENDNISIIAEWILIKFVLK